MLDRSALPSTARCQHHAPENTLHPHTIVCGSASCPQAGCAARRRAAEIGNPRKSHVVAERRKAAPVFVAHVAPKSPATQAGNTKTHLVPALEISHGGVRIHPPVSKRHGAARRNVRAARNKRRSRGRCAGKSRTTPRRYVDAAREQALRGNGSIRPTPLPRLGGLARARQIP